MEFFFFLFEFRKEKRGEFFFVFSFLVVSLKKKRKVKKNFLTSRAIMISTVSRESAPRSTNLESAAT